MSVPVYIIFNVASMASVMKLSLRANSLNFPHQEEVTVSKTPLYIHLNRNNLCTAVNLINKKSALF